MVLKLCCLLAIVTFGSSHVRIGRVPRQAVPPSEAWGLPPTNKTIAYRLDALKMSSQEKEELLAAMKYWSENTCIDFREARADDEFVATFTKTNSCHSPVGRSSIAVNAGCGFITDVHEIQHLLGISHTHIRSDRDKFIKIDEERMKRLDKPQYVMRPYYDLFGVPYDYGSILHYGAGPRDDPYFVPTLSVYDRTPGFGLFPSFYDVLLANMINLCNEDIVETCHESAIKCENGGYIHPRDCSKCVCPLGFTGRTCSEILIIGSCGGILNASDQWQNVTIQMNPKDMTFDIFNRTYCSWHIKAPPGKKIEINLKAIEAIVDCNYFQVCYAGFEFKIALDPRLTGPKVCCSSHLPRMVSQLNTVPIIGAIDAMYPMNATTSFTYRFVDGSTNSTLPDDYGIPLEASEPVTTTSTTTTTESPSTTTTTESTSTTTTTESPSTTTTTESPSTTTTTESPSTTTTTESPSTTTTTESPSTTTTTESPSTTTTTESPSTTTTTSEAPTTRQMPKTTTTDSSIVQSTTNDVSTSEFSTLPTTDTSTELPITTDNRTFYSTTDNMPTITHLPPTTTELSTESTNDVPIDCTTTYETSTTDASTETSAVHPTTVDDSTISTRTDFSATSTTTTTESPTTMTTTTEARTTISARKSRIITTQLPASTSPSNEKCAPNLPCSEGYLCNFRAGICERYAKNCTELKCNADEYCAMNTVRCDATECDVRPLCLNLDPRAPMTCRNHLCSKNSMCLMCPLCGNIPTCVDPTPVSVSRPFVYCGPKEPCAQGSLCNYKTGLCEARVYPTPGNG